MHGEEVGALVIVCAFLFAGFSVTSGVINGWMRGRQRQQIAEMIQRERVALIERGTEVDRLPSVQNHPLWAAFENGAVTERQFMNRRRQMLLMMGFVFTFVGVALGGFLRVIAGDNVWAVGLLPLSVGLALLLSAQFVKSVE